MQLQPPFTPHRIQKTPSLLGGLSKQGMFQHMPSRGLISFDNIVSVFISFSQRDWINVPRQTACVSEAVRAADTASGCTRQNLQYDTAFGGAGCWSRDPDSKEEEWWSFPPFLRPPVMKGSLTQIKRKDSNACASVAGASKCLKKQAGQQNFDLQFSLIYLFD